jgi:hypothetical protein
MAFIDAVVTLGKEPIVVYEVIVNVLFLVVNDGRLQTCVVVVLYVTDTVLPARLSSLGKPHVLPKLFPASVYACMLLSSSAILLNVG